MHMDAFYISQIFNGWEFVEIYILIRADILLAF